MRSLIKKTKLVPELLSSLCPVTNLRFMSKVVERVVLERINCIGNLIILGASIRVLILAGIQRKRFYWNSLMIFCVIWRVAFRDVYWIRLVRNMVSYVCQKMVTTLNNFRGCYIDCQLTLQRQINIVCSNLFYYLRKVLSIRDQVKTSVLIELIRVLVLSRVDCCNSLYYVLPNFLLAKLQRIINSAARLFFRLSPSTPTSLYLKQLDWLPIRQRITFKILM